MTLSPTPGARRVHPLTVVQTAAAALLLLAVGVETGAERIWGVVLALGLAVVWQALFARLRRRPMAWDGVAEALLFAALMPASVPLWQQGVAFSFGLVLGAQIFGARGRGFLNPVVVALSFLLISFPEASLAVPGTIGALAALVAGAGLLALGLLSWRITAGFALALAGLSLVWPLAGGVGALWNAGLLVALVFWIGDPVAAACTNAGRWVHGALAAGLVFLFVQGGGIGLGALVSAAFLASVFAPLVDQVVIALIGLRRARRAGHV